MELEPTSHAYPDGLMLFLGTMFAPVEDRDTPGQGFTHKIGDIVTIATPVLGALVNEVTTSVARFSDFVGALAFTNRVGGMAEEQQHHPDIHLSWGRVRVEIWTHKIDGLTESDFVFAAKADRLESA